MKKAVRVRTRWCGHRLVTPAERVSITRVPTNLLKRPFMQQNQLTDVIYFFLFIVCFFAGILAGLLIAEITREERCSK